MATGISEPIDMADRKIIQQLKRHDSMKKRMVYILVGFLFLAGCPQANADSASPKAVQRNGKAKSLLQEQGDKKEQRNDNATTNWDAIHAKYAAKKYKTEDSWELAWYKDYTGDSDSSPIDELKSMKIKLFGDSILYLNDKKLKVCRTVRDPFMYQRDALYYPSLTKYFANLGINITKSVPVLLLQSTMKDVYSDMLEYIYTGKYLALYCKGYVGVYKYISRKNQGLPSPTAHLVYTDADLYKDIDKEMSSKHARQYNIRAYKSKLKVLAGDRIEEMKSGGGFDFVKLPSYKGFPIFVCLNYNEDDEFLIFTYRNNSINIDNCINVLAFSSYNNEKESFAIFSDGTIYVKTVDEKGSHITVYRINNEGDFYKLN